ncbi:VWA domain-containing protein [Candidatus Woesearchaeota archaeon]|nr:VWA domain-containing protein [Candidatus Woesearchaeota archaeon]
MADTKNNGEEKETKETADDNNNSKDSSKFWQKIADEEYSKRKKDDKPDNSVLGQFLNPLIPPVVHVLPKIPTEMERNNTACFDFRDNQTYVSSGFMDKLTDIGGVEKRTAMRGILKHEVGHYHDYPRECSKIMYLGHIAETSFEETHREVMVNWLDLMDNLHQIRCQERGKDVFEVYKGFSRMLEKRLQLSQEEQELLRALGKNPDEIITSAREYSVDRLIFAYYQRQRGEDLGVRIEEGEYLSGKLKELMAIKYIKDEKEYAISNQEDDKDEIVNFILFGQIITDVIKKRRENIPKIKRPSEKGNEKESGSDYGDEEGDQNEGEGGDGKEGERDDDKDRKGKGKGKGDKEEDKDEDGKGSGSGDKDKDKEEGKDGENGGGSNGKEMSGDEKKKIGSGMSDKEKKRMLDDIIKRLTEPILKDTPDLRDFSDKQLNDGLNKIINKYGKFRYERVRDYVERATGRQLDVMAGGSNQSDGKLAGLEKSDLQLHDAEIPYYWRKASTHGVYIHKKPIVSDTFNSYPEGTQVFRVGDPIKTLNPFSTGGLILPGITKRYKLKQGHKRDRMYKVPHLLIVLDTSGSMKRPEDGSLAVLASFILARNYYENESSVGVINFSTDLAMLPPTRDINAVYSMLCAYWGGGTVLNKNKIIEYLERIAQNELLSVDKQRRSQYSRKPFSAGQDPNMPYVLTTDQDYEELIKGMHPDFKKQFIEKNLKVNLGNKQFKETYESIDTIIITDGEIFNIEELIDFINTAAVVTRNEMYLIDNRGGYKGLRDKILPNTNITPVDKEEDLIGLAVGRVKTLIPAERKPVSLFYR